MMDRLKQPLETIARWSAILTIFSLPISTSATLALFLATTLFILLSGQWKEKIHSIINNPIAIYFFLFYLLFILGAIYSMGNSAHIKKELTRLSWLLIMPLWIPLFQNQSWQTRATNAFLSAMAFSLIIAYLKYFIGDTLSHHLPILLHSRFSGNFNTAFKDHIIQSFLMSLASVIFLYRFIQRRQWHNGVLFLLSAANILMISHGRTGYIIFTLLLIYTLFSQLTLKATAISLASMAIIITLLSVLPGAMHQRVHYALIDLQHWQQGDKQTSLGFRMGWLQNAWGLTKNRPILGYGTGSITKAFASLPTEATHQTGVVDNTANGYFNIVLQLGLVGLLVYLGLLLMQWRYSYYFPDERGFIIRTALIAISTGNLANSWLMDFTQAHYYALMSIIMMASLAKHLTPSKAKDPAYTDGAAKDTPA
jgi:O-antigen ligase